MEKKKKLEYLKKLHDEVLTEKVILQESTEMFQIIRTKCKEIVNISLENKVG